VHKWVRWLQRMLDNGVEVVVAEQGVLVPSARAARPAVCRTLAECVGATPDPAAFATSGNAARLQALPVQLAASMQGCGRVTRSTGRAARPPPK